MSEHPNAPGQGGDYIEGEVVESTERAIITAAAGSRGQDLDASLAVALSTAEIDQQIATAKSFPRSNQGVINGIKELATVDTPTAVSCRYSLPRGRDKESGKANAISGPSIRFAEIVAQQFGNCRVAARGIVVDRKEMFVEAEGIFHDLEKNVAQAARVRRSIRSSYGKLYSEDMILVTMNAASSIAKRNAILAGVPRSYWGKAYAEVERVIRGDATTLANRRGELLVKFKEELQIKPAVVYQLLGVKGEADVGLDELVVASGFFSALRNNEVTVEDLLKQAGPTNPAPTRALSAAFGAKPGDVVNQQTGEVTEEGKAGESQSDQSTGKPTPESSSTPSTTTQSSGATNEKPPTGTPASSTDTSSTAETSDSASSNPDPSPEDATLTHSGRPDGQTPTAEGEQGGAESGPAPDESKTDQSAAAGSDAGGAATTASPPGDNGFPGDRNKAPEEVVWPDPTPGVAKPGESYLMDGDQVDAEGKRQTYRDGKKFSKVKRPNDLYCFTRHPEAALPDAEEAAAISSGEERIDEAQQEGEGDVDFAAFNAFAEKIKPITNWLSMKKAYFDFRKSDPYIAAPEQVQKATKALVYNTMQAAVAQGLDPVKPSEDPSYFALWIDHAEDHEIDAVYRRLVRAPAFVELKDEAKNTIRNAVNARKGEEV